MKRKQTFSDLNFDDVFDIDKILGEKLNRLAYVEKNSFERSIEYNNYSPDLPSWPFAINVTADSLDQHQNTTEFSVYAIDGDGFGKVTPFLRGGFLDSAISYMSVRCRNKKVKLVGFYDCSTKYGSNCGTEKTQTITDCREKFSPLGGGFFNNFVDTFKFSRKDRFDQIFGVYRRNNDSMNILFSTFEFEHTAYVRINTIKVNSQYRRAFNYSFFITAIGDDLMVRLRSFNVERYYVKTAIRKGWDQEPSEPNFIRVVIDAVSRRISIYNLNGFDDGPILTMSLCKYFELGNDVRYMSVTSDHFKTVDLYYDCCLPDNKENCHAYEKKIHIQTDIDENMDSDEKMESDENTSVLTTLRLEEEHTTMESNESDNNEAILPPEATMESQEISAADHSNGLKKRSNTRTSKYEFEVKKLKGEEKTKKFLDRSDFHDTGRTHYLYDCGTSMTDYCPVEFVDVGLMQMTEAVTVDVNKDNSVQCSAGGGAVFSGISKVSVV